MPTINYKNALIILNYLCRQQNLALTFKYYNQYYIGYYDSDGELVNSNSSKIYSSAYNKINDNEKFIIINLIKDLNKDNIYSIIKKYDIIPIGTSAKPILYYDSMFNTSTVTDVISQNDFVIEISKQ